MHAVHLSDTMPVKTITEKIRFITTTGKKQQTNPKYRFKKEPAPLLLHPAAIIQWCGSRTMQNIMQMKVKSSS